MDYLKIYRKGEIMAKVVDKDKKKGKKSVDNKEEKKLNIKIYEKCTCYVVALIIVLLGFAVVKNTVFIPALLITVGLELFCIAYYYIDNKNKKSLVYALFQLGVALVVAAIIYTLFKIV